MASTVASTAVKLVLYPLALLALIAFAPWLPPYMEVGEMTLPPELRKLEGPLAPNDLLDKLELVPGTEDIRGPDSVAVDGDIVYFGSTNGTVYKFDGTKTTKLGMTGEPCDRTWEAQKCGWPLGMRLDADKNLVLVDVYKGLLRMNTRTGKTETIVKAGEVIDGLPIKFPDDMDITRDGSTVYWSTLSTLLEPEHVMGLRETLAGVPSGALIKTDLKTKKSTVLIKNIHMANGVQLSKDEDFVLLVDTFQSRVLRYHLKGDKKDTFDVFIDRLPGIPDNLRSNGKDGFLIPFLFPRDESLVMLSKYPIIRKLIIRVEALAELALNSAVKVLGKNDYLGKVKLFLREFLVELADKEAKALVIEVDRNGSIQRSFHTQRHPFNLATNAHVGSNYVYFGCAAYGVYRIPKSILKL